MAWSQLQTIDFSRPKKEIIFEIFEEAKNEIKNAGPMEKANVEEYYWQLMIKVWRIKKAD